MKMTKKHILSIVGILAIILIVGAFFSSDPAEDFVKEAESLVEQGYEMLEDVKNGDMTKAEFRKEFGGLLLEFADEKEGQKIDDSEFSTEQKRRLLKAMAELEQIENKTQFWY